MGAAERLVHIATPQYFTTVTVSIVIKAILPFILLLMISIFLGIDSCWEEYRKKRGFKLFQSLFLTVGLVLCGLWFNYVWNDNERRAR
ncbi:MAG: hypothetical protein O7B35_15975, partial [Deltaproteobacteria bacterium]|nr:hypothetical protein [Deltaproteobacteria bacterium]